MTTPWQLQQDLVRANEAERSGLVRDAHHRADLRRAAPDRRRLPGLLRKLGAVVSPFLRRASLTDPGSGGGQPTSPRG